MAQKLHGLTQADRDKLKGMLANVNAGKKGPSRRPVATRRRNAAGGSGSTNIIVKITGAITARSSTVPGTGTAQRVSPDDFSVDIGDPFSIYNTSPRSLSGAVETVYCRATKIGSRYFIDTLDPIWFMNYTGVADNRAFAFDGGAGSANLVFRALTTSSQLVVTEFDDVTCTVTDTTITYVTQWT